MSVSAFKAPLVPAEQCVRVCVDSLWVAQHLCPAEIAQGKKALWSLESDHTWSHLSKIQHWVQQLIK